MLMKLLVSVFERAKSKITSTHSISRISSDSDNESDTNNSKQIFSSAPLVIHEQPRSSLSKWLCTNSSSVDKSIFSSKSSRVRRSSSWRSLKERGNNYIGHFSSRTLSVDELHRNQKKASTRKQQHDRQFNLSHSPIPNLIHQRQKPIGLNSVRLSNIDDASTSLSKDSKCLNRLSSKKLNQQNLIRNNTHSGGGDSGYSEESFATTTISSIKRPLHTSCPHCHCEQRSSFNNYKKSIENSSSEDSSTSDTTINTKDSYYHRSQHKQSLSASRSYPHIKPLPKTITTTTKPSTQRKRSIVGRRRRHLSCDSSLRTKKQIQQSINLKSSLETSESNNVPLQRHFTTIGMIHDDSSSTYSKNLSTLPKTNHIFGELNLAAIELDSVRTLDYHRPSFSSSYSSSLTSSSSSINLNNKQSKKLHHSPRKQTYLVWHEYKNSSLLSATNGKNIFSVIRGDQVRLLRRIGKSTLLVEKEDDGSIGFLPQSCLAHDQINSFLSVKGLRETVL